MVTRLNVFKTATAELSTSDTVIYTAPDNITTIILMAQVANVTNIDTDVTALHESADSTLTELVKDYPVLGNDAVGLLTGKLILEEGSSFRAFASANSRLKITLSLLESLNA